MDKFYNPQAIEEKWQRYWEQNKVVKVNEDPNRKKYDLLEMFAYPSGRIHMGHVRNYTIGDVVARFMMMRGYTVLHPMGWDAFGKPAENAALQSKAHPHDWTYQNIDAMRSQLKRLGFSYDWDRELATCDLIYYKWEQWLFLKMHERDLVYRRKSLVNWCESCQTPLAEEFKVPIVVTGFEPVDLVEGILRAVKQLEAGRHDVENAYGRAVTTEGNRAAQDLINKVFIACDRKWRGIGTIPLSGWCLRDEYAEFDAEKRFAVDNITTRESPLCISGLVLQGRRKPNECPAFGKECTPEHPLGATMVSSEGACAAYYRYRIAR